MLVFFRACGGPLRSSDTSDWGPGYPQPRSSKRKGGRGESTSPNTSDDTKHDGSTGTKTLCFTLISNQLKHNPKT